MFEPARLAARRPDRPGQPARQAARGPDQRGEPVRLTARWLTAGVAGVLVASVAGLALGPVRLNPFGVFAELVNLIPGIHLRSGLSTREAAIVTELRLPRVVLGLLVGATLALAGGCYQGVFRNPLADPYLLGVAAGAGLGATAAIAVPNVGSFAVAASGGTPAVVPPAAFVGALGAVALTYGLGSAGGARYRSPATLILAGVAVSSFLAAVQTYLQQRNVDTIREVYSWLLGRLATAGWHDVLLVLPYTVVAGAVVLAHRRVLDVLALGDEEAASLGTHPQRTRVILIVAASLATAAAVAVSGLIGFVGIVVPHTVRLLIGVSYRVILPLSVMFGAAFLALADLLARLVLAPAELPIGVVTAFLGAPFFVLVLRNAARVPW